MRKNIATAATPAAKTNPPGISSLPAPPASFQSLRNAPAKSQAFQSRPRQKLCYLHATVIVQERERKEVSSVARILIVDDEPLISLLLEDWLGELGHEVADPAHNIALRAGLDRLRRPGRRYRRRHLGQGDRLSNRASALRNSKSPSSSRQATPARPWPPRESFPETTRST